MKMGRDADGGGAERLSVLQLTVALKNQQAPATQRLATVANVEAVAVEAFAAQQVN